MRISIIVLILVIAVTAGGWVRTERTLRETRTKLEALQRASSTPEGTVTALFVQSDREHITYRIPKQTTVNGTVFVNYTEETAMITPATDVFGISVADPLDALGRLAPGHQISIKVTRSGGTSPIAQAIYVSP